MEENMIINEDLLDSPIFNLILDKVKKSTWIFLENTAVAGIEDAPSFYMNVSDDFGIYSPLYDLLCLPLLVACSKNNLKLSKIIRIRAGLITSCGKQVTHKPHVDYQFPHKTMLFYLTDSDGPTLLFDKKHSGNGEDKYWSDIELLKTERSINPVKNTSVIFDGLTFHSSTTPKENPFRIVINYNFID
jgi:hypothetical protein